jgi:hypothetical protein
MTDPFRIAIKFSAKMNQWAAIAPDHNRLVGAHSPLTTERSERFATPIFFILSSHSGSA